MERISGIYKITCVPTGKVYIGQSCDIYNRWNAHKLKLNKNIHVNSYLQNAWNKYGENNFDFIILKECKENIDKYEKEYIKTYNSCNRVYGFNIEDGGCETKSKSAETIEKIRNARSKPVCQYDLNKNLLHIYSSTVEAAKAVGAYPSNIWYACAKSNRTANGYLWRYQGDSTEGANKIGKGKRVFQFDKNKKLIGTFEKIVDAAKETGVQKTAISACIRGKSKSAGGYFWSSDCNDDALTYISVRIKAVNQYDKNMNLISSYSSVTKAAKENGLDRHYISDACKNNKEFAGYLWKYKEEVA